MKKIIFYLTILFTLLVSFSSCNDEWEEEL